MESGPENGFEEFLEHGCFGNIPWSPTPFIITHLRPITSDDTSREVYVHEDGWNSKRKAASFSLRVLRMSAIF